MFEFAFVGIAGGQSFDAFSVNWSNISASGGATEASTADLTLSFVVGPRSISASKTGTGTLYYRIDSGAWVAYGAPFTINSGQSLGWRIEYAANTSGIVTVTDASRGVTLDTFAHNATDIP